MANTRELKKRCSNYRSHLKKAMQFLANHNAVIRSCSDMCSSCKSSLSNLCTPLKRNTNPWRFEVSPIWRIPISKNDICGAAGEVELAIAGYVDSKDGLLKEQSTSVSVIITPNKKQPDNNGYDSGKLDKGVPVVLRRFHFDYDLGIEDDDRPRSHLQYGGIFEDPDNAIYHLFSTLRFPRVPYQPLDIVLTLDLFLRDFPTPLRQIVDEYEWKSLVKKSEDMWSAGYYKEIANHLNRAERDTSLYERQCAHVDWIGTT